MATAKMRRLWTCHPLKTKLLKDALASIASDEDADEDLADTCGESLATIWCRKNLADRDRNASALFAHARCRCGKDDRLAQLIRGSIQGRFVSSFEASGRFSEVRLSAAGRL